MGYCEVLVVVLIVASARCQEQNATSDVSSETSSLQPSNTEEMPRATSKSTQQKLDSPNDAHPKLVHNSKKHVLDGNNEIIPLEESTDNDFIEAIINAEDQLLEDIHYSSASENERNDDDDHHHEKEDETALPSEGRIHFQTDSWPQFQRRVSQQDSWPPLHRRVSQQGVDFDDSRQEKPYSNRRTLNGRQTIRDSTGTDGRPLLQLTQGGYSRPYLGVTRPQRQEITQPQPESGPDNERDSKQDTRTDTEDNPALRTPQPQIVPVSAYGQPFGSFPNVQSFPGSFFGPQRNAVPMSDFGNNFQQQFLVGNDVGGYPSFARNPSAAGEFQGASISPFPNGGYFLPQDRTPFMQPQPMLPGYQQQPQFVPVAGFPGFETLNEAARPDYSAFFRPPSQSPMLRFYGNSPGMSTTNAAFNPNYPIVAPPYSSSFLRHPSNDNVQKPVENAVDSQDGKEEQEQKQQEDIQSGREDEYTRDSLQDNQRESKDESVPFGARLRTQGPPFDNVFIRYPLTEAGYGTPEYLPRQNGTGESNASDSGRQPPRLFLGGPPRLEYPFPRGRDPYREALDAFQNRQNESDNHRTSFELPSRQYVRGAPAAPFVRPPPGHSQGIPNEAFFGYPDRSQDIPGLATFFPGGSGNELRSGFPFLNSQRPLASEDPSKTPECAKKTNASMCFEDENYPRREVLHSLSTNSYILERLVSPGQSSPADLSSEEEDSKADQEDFVCKVDVRRGGLLRAVNSLGLWKVVVDAEPSLAGGRFSQPVRLETCREAEEPCNYTNSRVKTKCVQKTSLQRLLAWDSHRGIHVDLFRLPVACTCQVLEAPET